jgi:hypothetical protein
MESPEPGVAGRRSGRWLGLAAVVVVLFLAINSALTRTTGVGGVAPGRVIPVFAVPLALGDLDGDANIATRAGEGSAGRVPACSVRGSEVLNICELDERAPLVLALFVDAGSCPAVLTEMQALVHSFPSVRFAAVAIKGQRAALRRLIDRDRLTFPLGIDRDGVLASLYGVASCPQLTFVLPGGIVQSPALLARPSSSVLLARVSQLVAAARARPSGRAGG